MIESKCPCRAPAGPVPQQRIIEKLNEYMSRRDYAGAERHLLYWLGEAEVLNDQRGRLMLCNELAGHYRKTGERDKALAYAGQAVNLIDELDYQGTVSAGTSYVNAATVYNAFGENERSLALFEKAREIYESREETDPSLLGGLYNNMALTCAALQDYDRAFFFFDKAVRIMETVPGGHLEQAITYLNMADTFRLKLGMEEAEIEIFRLLDRAEELLLAGGDGTGDRGDRTTNPLDPGYYAFVCEKCAPTFSYYGYFLTARELESRAENIYAGT